MYKLDHATSAQQNCQDFQTGDCCQGLDEARRCAVRFHPNPHLQLNFPLGCAF